MNNVKVGFIGQGFIGGNMADDFEERGFSIVRYSLEDKYKANKEKIKECDVVFIAVPTPTKPDGFDDSIIRNVVSTVGKGKIAVIKSTILPGGTQSIQKDNPDIFVFHSPEFLREVSAKEDTRKPERNLVGIPVNNLEYNEKAKFVLSILPQAPYEAVLSSVETELIKYVGNNFLYTKVVFMNMMYDLAQILGADWQKIKEAVIHDKRIGGSHMEPVHSLGRGAGGHCFIKDFEALRKFYEDNVSDPNGVKVLDALKDKNNELLTTSGKDLDILSGVYGNLSNSQ